MYNLNHSFVLEYILKEYSVYFCIENKLLREITLQFYT